MWPKLEKGHSTASNFINLLSKLLSLNKARLDIMREYSTIWISFILLSELVKLEITQQSQLWCHWRVLNDLDFHSFVELAFLKHEITQLILYLFHWRVLYNHDFHSIVEWVVGLLYNTSFDAMIEYSTIWISILLLSEKILCALRDDLYD